MKVEEIRESSALVLSLSGRLDAQNAPVLQEQVMTRVENGATSIVMDLEGIDYVSSAGLRVVLMAAKRLEDLGGRFVVCSLCETVLEVFRISGIDSILELVADRTAALDAIS